MVAEANGNGVFERYLRGIGLLAREQDGSRQYYLHNGHGDVVERTDQKGTALHRYRYDAFGNEENPVSLDPNPWRYCGEYYDAETGTYYLRARYYAPGLGRFLSEDRVREATYQLPNQQKVLDPLSLNLYTYCKNNPILLTDPSGMVSQALREYYNSKEFKKIAKYARKHPEFLEEHLAELFSTPVDDWDFDSIIFDEALVARLLFHEDSSVEGQYAIAWTIQNNLKDGTDIREIIKTRYANPKWMTGANKFFRPNEVLDDPNQQVWVKWHPDFKGEGESTRASWIMAIQIAQDLLNGELRDNPFTEYTDSPDTVVQYVGLGYETDRHVRIGNSWFLVR